eukprot:scaffold25817_cov65-Phaeocystis_antarctica.AAC.13
MARPCPPRVVFVIGFASLMNSLTSGKTCTLSNITGPPGWRAMPIHTFRMSSMLERLHTAPTFSTPKMTMAARPKTNA